MRTTSRSVLILLTLALAHQPLRAQAVDLTDARTTEQKLNRTLYLIDFAYVAFIAHAKSMGQTTEQLSEWMVGFAAPSWGAPGSATPASFVRGMFRNYNLYSDLQFEILSESASEIRGRMNSPYAARFGDAGESNGVKFIDFQRMMSLFYEGVADHLGFDMTHEIDGEWVTFTVKTR